METIHDFLAAHAHSKANDEAFTFIEDSGEKSQISFNELHQNASSIAQYLTTEFKAGSRVVLLFPPGLEYIQAFLGCLYAGVVAVPLYPPQSKKHAGRVLTVIDDCEASLVLTNNALKQQLEMDLAPLPVMSFDQLTAFDSVSLQISPTADQIAFLQYTSGSTGTPKGVVISHSNIIANLKTLQQATHCSQEDVFCNWLPLFHDLGLVNALLLPIFLGAHSILMSPVRFIKSPLAWLKAITEYKASICGAPNFAFDHCLERIRPHQLAGIDLSSWRIAFNAAEPVDADTLLKFSDRFSRVGFKESAIFPAYGMSEATVFICGGSHATAYLANPFSNKALQKGQAQLPEDSDKQQILIAHGHVQAEHHLKIVSPKTLAELPDDQVGEIWFSGPSLAQGYWKDAEKTKVSFGARLENDENGYLRTGDLGFIHQGELYISGRIKDVLIIKGRNYYPQDFEKLAYNVYPGLSQNGTAAFEVKSKAVLLLEVSRNEMKEFDYQLACETIKTAIFEQFEVVLEDILFLKAGGINRTSSGKIQRSLSKKRYLADDLDYLYSASKGGVSKGEPEGESSQQTDQVVVFDSELEVQLCALWQEVLGLDSIGVEDNFLNLGGHSLLATTLIAQIQKKWNVEVSISSFFTANTIRKLAKVIETASVSQLPAIQPVAITDSVLPSFAQERMWFVNQIESELAQYNLSFSLKLYGELNESFLQQAFTIILTRHQALRTTFNEDDGQVHQTVQESFQFDIATIDLTDLTKADQESRVAELSGEEAAKHFNLSEDLMLRVTLLKLNAQSHVMLLTVHHIAADGWSLGVLTKELNALYAALTFGSENPLAQLDIQYIDYAYWQRDWLKEEVLQNHLRYWKEHLSDIPVIHGLSLDNARPAVQSFKGASVQYTLAKELHEGLNNLARENEATLFMLLNAAFASFLSRYSGETDIVIGSPIANREQAEVAPLIGLFINNLVFRSDLSTDPAFVDLLQQSKEHTFAAYDHQQMPFEKLVDELQPERNLSHSPLFQVMLILQNQEMESLNLPGLEAKQLKSCNTFAQYDLTLTLNESDNGLEMEWQYATDLFCQATIERMIGHFEVLLQAIIKSPETKVSQLPLLNTDESIHLLKNWNDTVKSFPQDKCIHDLFETQVELNPGSVATIFNKEELTYSQLNQRANQLARYLVKQGVKPDSVVGVCVERSFDLMVSVLAIMKSGGAYLPLDPTYPKARLEYMVEDSGVQWVITQKHLAEQFSADSISEGQFSVEQVIYLEDERIRDELKQLDHSNLDKDNLGLTSNHLAYVIYTSGSTGKPKGVMLEHHNLTNFLTSMRAEPGLTKEDNLLAVTSLSFDIHVLELFLPLIVGGRVVIASSENVLSPDELAQLIEDHQVTSMQATPATWKMLVSNDWQPQNKLKALCGGEALSKELKDELLARETIELWNMYGPTETAVWSATRKIENVISLGAPIANTQFYVLDVHLNPVPVGVAGELHIGGEGVARGYLNRPELTEERFIQNPFSNVQDARIYKTGDLVRWLPDGTLEYLRRLDLQVKIRGHRIELGEIESGLQQHPEVQNAVVHIWNEGGFANLVAYVTGKSPAIESDLQKKLTDYLEAFLPAYMIPNAFVCLEQIPLTPNGKIDRNALPKPQFNNESEYVAPETATEKQLCEIWQQLLNLEVEEEQWISVSSNFFHLGGHSLLAARLVSQIRKHWKVEVPIRTLFTEQTVRKLANVIDCASVSKMPEIVTVSSSESVPLSFAQKRLWFIDQIEEGRHQYNLCRGFQLSGKLNLPALTFAFKKLVERHQVLRTTYLNTGIGDAIQVVSSDFDIAIPVVDLTDLNDEKQEQVALEYIQEETNQIFDLSNDRMIRVKLLKFESDSHALLVTIHHIALDGWSESIIINELNTLYHAKDNLLPVLEIQYSDYAWWQHTWLQGDVLKRHLQFWKERLQGLPEVHSLPLDHPRPAMQTFEGLRFNQVIGSDIQQGLNALAQKHDASLFMVLNAAFAVLLWRHSNADDIVIGTPVANREQAELAPLVGFFANTLVLRSDLSGNPGFEDLLKQSKDYLLEAYEHQQLPFEKLIEELQPERSLSFSPLFQVMLVMQNNEAGELELPDLSIKEFDQQNIIARYDLTLNVMENHIGDNVRAHETNGLTLAWEYSTALFDAATIERMAGHFEVLLRGIIDSSKTTVGELPLLTTAEKQQINKWNETQVDYSKERYIHELFEAHAMSHPEDVAVILEGDSLSYGELNAKANQLAHYLVEQGVKPDTLVGLCIERSFEMVIGVLGIAKAGGAYLPLDIDLPAARLNYMLQDSGVDILLTQERLLEIFLFEKHTTACEKIACLDQFVTFTDYSKSNIDKALLGLEPQHLAYVIYTSGSTGQPKGVESTYLGMMNRLDWMHSQYQLKAEDRVLQKTPYSFDVSVWEFFWTLGYGAQLIIAKPEGHKDPEYLREVIQTQQVSVVHFVPSMLANMLTAVNFVDLPSVRYVFCSGEALPKKLVDDFHAAKSPNTQLFNLYGPTEASIDVTHWACEENNQLNIIPIGQAINNTQLYVLNDQLKLAPVGVAGELYIGGDGLARGYLNRPELTDAKFIADPFSDDRNARLYKTGDLARWLPDSEALTGNLEYIGRIDHQVKIRGFRIELGEIESTLLEHDDVSEAIVVARDDEREESKTLVAYLVMKTPSAAESDNGEQKEIVNALRVYLKQSLPDYMMPSAFVMLDHFPLTANGKVNRRALPKPDFQAQLSSQFIAPTSDIEKQLSEIWQTLLKMEGSDDSGQEQFTGTQNNAKRKAIGINDNFFELGGHSLLAVGLVSEIRARFQVAITVGDIFRQPTIGELALMIENTDLVHVSVLGKAPDDEPISLSFAQQSLWLIDQINPNQTQYNIPLALQLEGELDIKAITSAFESIIERHQILRTTVQLSDSGDPIQRVLQDVKFAIPVTDRTDLSSEAQHKAVLRHAEEEAAIPFDLSTDLMLRAQLLKLSQSTHVILVTMHHIASDGWSQGILLNEFNLLYRSFIGEESETLAQLPIQYADYAWGQRQWLQGEVLEQQLRFWKERLQGLPEVHNLPLDYARPVVQDHKGTIYYQTLSSDIQEGLKALAHQNEVTMFMVLSAAYSILLSRYSGETDIVFGTPVANRDQVELASLVGFFTNALVIRTDLSDNPHFNDLLHRSKEYLLGAYEHQQLPFEKLVDELQEQRNLSYSPLYQVKLALQNNELGEIDLPGLAIKQLEKSHSVALHDLSLDIYELEDEDKGLELHWEYATSLFDASTIERMAKHFEVLLKGIIEKPQARISKLPCITTAEQEQLLTWSKWSSQEDNSTVLNFANRKDLSVLDLFEEQVANNPNTIAVMFNESAHSNERLTYQELNAKANQVAHYLLEQKVTPDTLVGLCVERSLEMIIGIWGILKAGSAYVPIDPDYPEKHIEHILDDSDIEIILTSSELLSELPFDELQILPLDDELWEGFLGDYSQENTDRESQGLSLTNLAYVIYTSGSTGLPKGVAIEHKALAQSTLSRFDVYQESPDSFALFSSFAFDSSIVGIFWTLVSGGKLCIVDIKQGLDLTSFQSLMTEEQVSHFLTLPSLYLSMLSADLQPSSSLKTVIVAGEDCVQNLVKQHQSHGQWKHCRLFNEYGPTEACVWSSYYDCTHHSGGAVPIGTTVPHADLFVLDNELQHCPLGVTGELYIGGESLARGYLDDQELTDQKFIPSPFHDGQRLYKTGDLVRCMPDQNGLPGNLEFIGRSDHQIKIRGFRIELGEIEAAIAEYEHVSEVVVLAKTINSSQNSKQLVAYVVPKNNNGEKDYNEFAFRESLQTYLTKSLLNHKIPSVFVMLDKLPNTPNGKVDRQSLQAKEVPSQLTDQYVAPKTEIEKQLCEIWQSLLKVKKIGITENFFSIGGDSIQAIQAVTRAAKEGVVFTTRQLFESQTIEKLASQIRQESQSLMSKCEVIGDKSQLKELTIRFEQWKRNQADDQIAKISTEQMWRSFLVESVTPSDFPLADVTQTQLDDWFQSYPNLENIYPTTGMQTGMLYHSSLDAEAYVSQLSLILKGKLDLCAFKLALDSIVNRYDVFRTVYTDDHTHQLVLKETNLDLNELDWSEYNESEQQQRIDQFLQQDKEKGFDFKQAPLMRITLVALSKEKHCLIWSSHHALSDGWSFPLVFKEVITLYEEASRDATGQVSMSTLASVLPETPPYEHYINWLAHQDEEKARAYWSDMLGGFDTPNQINAGRKTDNQSKGARNQWLKLTPEMSGQLQSAANHHQVTLNTLVQAAWAYLLYHYSGDEHLVFGETVSGRPAEINGVEQIVGLFINSLPVVVNIKPEQEIGAWLRAMHLASIDRVENGFLPLSEIQKLSPINNKEGRERNLFDSLVVFENFPVDLEMEKAVVGSELEVSDVKVFEQTNYALTLTVLPEQSDLDTKLSFKLGYHAEYFEEATTKRILAHFELILRGLLEKNCNTVGELPILTAKEERQLLVDWNDTYSDYPKDKCIHELFEEQVERHPDSVAVVFDSTDYPDEVLTYRELNAKANQVAHYLLAQGIKPDSLVGLCVERSLEMVIGIFGIVKAGGAYVPLDPSYPSDRLDYMLEDSGVKILLTQKYLLETLASEQHTIVCLDQFETFEDYSKKNIDKLSLGLEPHHLVHVIYTSGSTGKPKGVESLHRGLMNRLDWMQSEYQLRADDRVLQKTPYSFDVSVWEFLWTLGFGAQLIVAKPEGHKDPDYLQGLIQRRAVTILHFVPSMLSSMLAVVDWSDLSSIRYVFCSGEALPKKLVDDFMGVKPAHTQLFNLYGPTEASIDVSHWACEKNNQLNIIPIGRPISNTQLYVLSKQLVPVPLGVAGELHIGGDCLARGYLNQPELTNEKFISNPFSDDPNDRLYKTGDLVRWLPNTEGLSGNLEFIGRIDHQVKIRGFRIELGEIESTLLKHKQISEALVVVHTNHSSKDSEPMESHSDEAKRLVAYIVPSPIEAEASFNDKDDEEIDTHLAGDLIESFQELLMQSLPDYMVPSTFVALDQFPLTHNGKIDRKALPIPDESAMQVKQYVAPETDIEKTLCKIWQDLLTIERVGITDNFFAIGGDSILSIQAVARSAQVGLVFTTRQLFENQTIKELAPEINLKSQVVALQDTVTGGQELLPIQRKFLSTDFIDQNHYNQSVLLKTSENFSFEDLQKIVAALYQRHDVLRLSVDEGKAMYLPLNNQLAKRATQYHDLSQLEDEAWKRELFNLGAAAKAGLSLAEADIFKAVLFKGKNGQSRVLLTLHHMVVDGVSWRIILQDVTQAFEQLQQQEDIKLLPKSSSFQQWGQYLLEHSNSDAFQSEKDYWLSQVQEPVNVLPVDHSVINDNRVTTSQTVSFQLTATKTQALLNQCTSTYRTQINDLLLSALYLGLYQWTGQTRFRIDLEGHGRESLTDSLDLTQTAGWFTSVYPVNLAMESADSISDVIKTIKERLRKIPNNGIGFGLFQQLTRGSTSMSADRPSDLLFNYLGQFDQTVNKNSQFQAAFESVGEDISLQRQRSHLLELNGMVTGGQLEFSLSYNRLQYDQKTTESLMQSIKSALYQIIEHCQSIGAGGVTPSDFPLSQVNQTQLDEWYQTYPNLEKLYPTTGLQKGLLFHSSLDSSAYVSQFSLDLDGTLDFVAMQQAWNEVVRRHDVFRTVFSKDHTLQLVFSEVNLSFTTIDFSEYSEAEQQQRLAQLLKEDKAQGFDLEQMPLMRIILVSLSEQRYRMTWSSHHALSDGWSQPIVFKEVLTFYQLLKEGKSLSECSSTLSKVQSYEDYIAWLQQQDHEVARSYWKNRLVNREAPAQNDGGGIAPHKSSKSGVSIIEKSHRKQSATLSSRDLRIHSVTLTQEKSAQLQSLAQHHHVTLSTLIQGAWAYLLHCYSGKKQVIFGETISGRPAELKGVEEMVGMFINSIPVCVTVETEQEIGTWLQSIHQSSIDRVEHGFLPLFEIQELSSVDKSNSEDGLANRSLFNTLLVFDNYPVDQALKENMEKLGLTITDIISDQQNNYGLTLKVVPGGGPAQEKLNFALLYQLENYEKETIERLSGHFEMVLTGLLNHTLQTVGELPILTSKEEGQLLVEWNDTAADYPKAKCIHQLFAEQAALNPDKIAVVDALQPGAESKDESKQLTFKQLYDQSRELALYLQSQGVVPDTLIGLCAERSQEMMVGIMGILQAGGAYVPLDPDYPEDRLAYMLEDSQANIVITQNSFKDKVKALVKKGTQVIVLDEEGCLPKDCTADLKRKKIKLREDVKPDNLAYVIYTSGSTGRPKGVMIEHRMVVDYCYSVFKKMDLHLCETFASVSTFSSDLGNIALYVPMMFSKTLYLFSNEYVNNPIKLHNYMDNHPIDCMKVTPSHFEMFKVSDTKIVTVSKALIFAGEPLTKQIVDLVNTLNPDCKVFNNYGPTETTISKIASSALTSSNTADTTSIHLGKPLNNTQVYILDQNNNPVPVGVPGELHIAGDGLARGYLNRPELTKEKFIPDPFNPDSVNCNSRMYKSGDLARWLDDGNIEYLGRIDTQVKIRGFRIETGEIEAVLNQHPEINSSVVVAQRQENAEGAIHKQLIAYYVANSSIANSSEQTIDSDELKEHLLQTLPEYMLPVAFVNLEAIPLTSNGKVDRRTLEQMNVSLSSGQVYLAPRNEMEEKLVTIWSEILQMEPEKIGVNDDFFSLGGHSLLAVMLVSKVKRKLEVSLSLESLFNLKTISGTAELINVSLHQLEASVEEDGTNENEFVAGTL